MNVNNINKLLHKAKPGLVGGEIIKSFEAKLTVAKQNLEKSVQKAKFDKQA